MPSGAVAAERPQETLYFEWFFKRYFSQTDLLERVPKCFIIIGVIFASCHIIGFALLFEKKSDSETQSLVQNMNINEDREVNIENSEKKEEETNNLGVK